MRKISLNKLMFPLLFLLLAVIGHSFYIYRFFKDGTIFTGPNDGLEQMLPMQLYLYNQWSHGRFFYDLDFGLGGDYYTDLAYYYSTSVIFFFNMIGVWWLNLIFDFKTDTIQFWAKNAFYISIVKSAVAMGITYLYFRKIKIDQTASVLGAFLFLTSAIYFRFTLYWSFFSDIFIWLPLLLLAIERYIQEGKKGWFIAAVALTFINNFYFAYYQLLAGLIYFLLRNIFRHQDDFIPRGRQWMSFIIMSVLGVGISLFSFFYGVKGFMQNDRAPFTDEIPLFSPFDQNANIFYDNYLVIVLFIAVQALFTFKFYRSHFYRFFALMTIALILLSFMPFIDSVFNGFSAPQKRWHYLLTFFSSGLIAMYIARFKAIPVQDYIYSLIPGFIIVFMSYFYIDKKVEWIWFLPVIALIGLAVLVTKERMQQTLYLVLIGVIMLYNWDVVKVHNIYDNYNPGINDRAKMSYIESSVYDSGLQRQIITQLNNKLKPGERIDWRVLEQDNTPMYQGFNGVSLYSSIFDGSLIDFYYNQLKINLKEESISRYSTFQSRSNLESLFNVKYLVRKDYQKDIPSNFKLIQSVGKYRIYENQQMLSPVRMSNTLYSADDLKQPIDREHAMIKGIVLDQKGNSTIQPTDNLLSQSTVTTSGASWSAKDRLTVNPPSGGLVIQLPKSALKKYDDFYLDMHVELTSTPSNIQINVNGYANNRLFKGSKYRMHQDNLLYRVSHPANGKILVGLTNGEYKLVVNGIYGENYKTLKTVQPKVSYQLKENGNHINIKVNNVKQGYLLTPVTYREGMTAKVDGHAVEVERANYLMSAVKVPPGSHTITFKYIPPYFYWMIFLSLLSLIIAVIYVYPQLLNKKRKVVHEKR